MGNLHLIHLINGQTLECVADTKDVIKNIDLYNAEQSDPDLMCESIYCTIKDKDEEVGDIVYTYYFTLPSKTAVLRPVKLRPRDIKRQTVNLANSVWSSPYNISLEDF